MKKVTVMLLLLSLICVAAQAKAGDAPGYAVTIGGLASTDMGWQIVGKDNEYVNSSGSTINNFFATLNLDSYMRATFSSGDKNTGAQIELGMASTAESDGVVYLHYAYGWWNIGSYKLLAGRMDSRLAQGGTMQKLGSTKSGKDGSGGFGFIGAARNPKLVLQGLVRDNISFEIALGQAGTQYSFHKPFGYGEGMSSSNNYLPRVEMVVDLTFENFSFGLGAGVSHQQIKVDYSQIPHNADYDDKTLSYLLWIPAKYNNGPFQLLFNAHFGQNTDMDWAGESYSDFELTGIGPAGNGAFAGQPYAVPFARDTGNGFELENTISWGMGLDLNYALSDKIMLALGGGFTHLSNDAWGFGGGIDSYTRWTAYVAMPLALSANFFIQPEVGYYNYGDSVGQADPSANNNDAGDEWLLGVTFMFLF